MIFFKLVNCVLCNILAKSCYVAVKKLKNHVFFLINPFPKSSQHISPFPCVTQCVWKCRESDIVVCDVNVTLLRSKTFFPYFMLVAFEGGSIVRAFLLLISYPILWVLNKNHSLRFMVFATFCGLRLKDMEIVGRSVLPKFYLKNLNRQVYKVLVSTGRSSVFTSVPKIMVEGFLKEYLKINDIVGTELQTVGSYFTGFLNREGLLVKEMALKDFFGDKSKPDIGLGNSRFHDHLFIPLCKEAYVVNKEELKGITDTVNTVIPREEYPKPLVFHDGRLAFMPTPTTTLFMFVWLPLGIALAIFRLLIGIFLPYKIINILSALSGVKLRTEGTNPLKPNNNGVLYVCTHRTLLDPIFLSLSLMKLVTAVTYSLSKISELISPIRTFRLTRDRNQDGKTIRKFLSEGDLVVCPEGTTCREPYLLRFSSLFAELTDEIVPVAINTHVTMFYGTTATGFKCLDPIFFLMNPSPRYSVQILEKVPRERTCSSGWSSYEVSNDIQRRLADAWDSSVQH
ncbi:hypothetical protein GIB67_024122 [Kingdonia uniflora]|uniref:Phospholipid/glycerol acyltransferase domain-containing protein n=1 Tax=Kingdonia uniflora TaxID=39325 RepID=A0A7J7MN03_9MAGN|nr:hypothetical protein GIB67_024122 [Kingdonia uniflora]